MARIKMLTGVVEVGLFCHMAKAAYFGNAVSQRRYIGFQPADYGLERKRYGEMGGWEDRNSGGIQLKVSIQSP